MRDVSFIALVAIMIATAVPLVLPIRSPVAAGPVAAAGGVTGLLGMLCLWWQVLLGNRHLTRWISPDRSRLVRLHTWLGILGAFFVLSHPLLEMIVETRDVPWLWELDFEWIESGYTSVGRIALFLFLLLWLSSTLARFAVRYRWWYYLHLLAYPLVGLVLLHADGIGTFLDQLPGVHLYWTVLAWSFLALVAAAVLPLFFAVPGQVVGHSALNDRVGEYTLRLGGTRRPVRPGQFIYLRTRRLQRAHPFSVVAVDGDLVTIAVEQTGSFTAHLQDVGTTGLLVDGPHGVLPAAGDPEERIVVLAGGIGITPFLHLLRTHTPARTWLFHLVRQPQDALYQDELQARLGQNYHCNASAITGRFPVDTIPENFVDGTVRYLVCGSPRFVEGATRALRRAGVPRSRLTAESFEL